MRLRTHRLLSALRNLGIAGCIISSLVLNAQTTISAIGNPNESARFPIENGFINLGNGNVHLEIPIAAYPQRGDLSVAAKFVYDSSIWQVVNSPDYHNPEWYPALTAGSYDTVVYGGLGWTFQYGRYYEGAATINSYTCPAGSAYNSTVVYSNIQWSDPQGTLHAFPITTTYVGNCPNSTYTNTPGGQGYAVDGSGYYAVVSSYTTLQIWDSKGTQVVNMPVSGNGESGNPTIDRNGNYISYSQQGAITADSLQHPNISETVTSWDSYGNPAVVQLSVPIAQGQTATYTITYENIAINTDFHISGAPFGYGGYVEEFDGVINVIGSIGLPDGTSYAFQYDQCPSSQGCNPIGSTNYAYGELTGITLPHGGTVSLGFTSDANAGTTEPARWVSSHSGSDGSTTFKYQYAGNYSNAQETGGYSCQEDTNTVTSATLQSTYIFSNCNGNILPMKVLLSPVSNTSSVDAFVLFHYDFSHPCQEGACTGAQWTNLLGKTVVLPSSGSYSSILAGTSGSGLISDIQYQYATPGSGIATSIKQWDFYSGSYPTSLPDSPSGSPTRETDLVLGKTVNYALFPTQKTIVNSTGSTTFTYSYDESSYSNQSSSYASGVSASSIPNQNSQWAASAPGNLTTITECCAIVNGSSVSLAKHFYYDVAGSIVESTDPNSHNTYFGYDATDTFAEQITLPPTSGLNGTQVAHVTKPVFDFNSGQIASFSDQNRQTTTYTYDSLGRLWTVKFSNGGNQVTLKTITYNPSANETNISELQSPGVNISSSAVVDGFGRPNTSTMSGVTTTTNYDSQGRLQTVTNPEASTSYSTDGTTTYGYDELNRIKSVEMPNSQSVQYNYSLNTVTITDPSGHSRQEVYDAFGDLSEVLEPSATGTPNWSTAWATTYSYNGLGLLSSISQQGGSSTSSNWRTRNFYYDGAGRLYSQATPEQGTFTFGYDYNGNLTSSTNQNSTNNTVSYFYDADNRMYQEVVSGGPTYSFTYDAQDSSGDSFGVGRLTGTSDGSKTQTVLEHDPMGNVVSSQYCLPSGGTCTFGSQPQAEVQAQFDFQGNMTSLTYPDGRQITQSYDLLNRPVSETYAAWQGAPISTPYNYASNILYYPPGELQAATYGNGIQMGATFDPDQNISSLVYLGNGSALSSKIYTWDPNAANVSSIKDLSTGRTQSFTYDQLNRIASAADTGTTTKACLANPPSFPAYSETYSIDPWANLQESTGTLSGSQSFTFTYTPSAINQISGTGVQYDSAGNLKSDGSPFYNSYLYRGDGLMSGSNGATYTYDALGERVQKVYGSTTTEYIYFGGLLLAEYNPGSASWMDRIYGPGGALATVAGAQNAVPVYRLTDHLGSLGLSTTTNAASGITGVAGSLPFGEMTINSGSDNFPFTDHERDGENTTDATLFRHYAPAQLRWLSPDSYNGSYDLSDPQSLNRYAYLTNRPMSATDPTGLDGQDGPPTIPISNPPGGGGDGGDNGPPGGSFGSGSSGTLWGSESGPIVSSGFTGGGALSNNYFVMSHPYDPPGAQVREYESFDNAPIWQQLLFAPIGDAMHGGDEFRYGNRLKGVGYGVLAAIGFIPGEGQEEEVVLTTAEKITAATNGVREGIYVFPSRINGGIKYVGQSSNIARRLSQWVRDGRLAVEDLDQVVTKAVTGGKTAREVEEQVRILLEGGIENLLNVRNPIGLARANLLPQWARTLLRY